MNKKKGWIVAIERKHRKFTSSLCQVPKAQREVKRADIGSKQGHNKTLELIALNNHRQGGTKQLRFLFHFFCILFSDQVISFVGVRLFIKTKYASLVYQPTEQMEEEYRSEGTNERHKDEAVGNIWNTHLIMNSLIMNRLPLLISSYPSVRGSTSMVEL